MKKGKVSLVGAGPGDLGLVTLRAKEYLEQADAVVYDNLVDTSILDWCKATCQKIYVGKKGFRLSAPTTSSSTRKRVPGLGRGSVVKQKEINALLIRLAQSGKTVVRLKGGDPFIFGRGGEEAEALAAQKIPFEIVPGITSAIAVPTYAGIPLTHRLRSSMVTFVTGHEDPAKEANAVLWRKLTPQGTLVILMGVENLSHIVQELLHRAWSPQTQAAVIQWGTFPDQRVVTGTLVDIVGKVQKNKLTSPAVIVLGEVVGLREKLDWFERKPLFGKTIIVTRPKEQNGEFIKKLRDLGAKVIPIPMIKIVPLKTSRTLDRAIEKMAEYSWLIFTSVNGVEQLARYGSGKKWPAAALAALKTCAIGPKTAERMRLLGFPVTAVAKEYRAEGIVRELGDVSGQKILVPRAQEARDLLIQELRKKGAQVDVIPVYKTVKDPAARGLLKKALRQKVDCVTFTSSSTASHFLGSLSAGERRRLFQKAKAASIGPITSQALRRFHLKPAIEARDYTTEGLVQALVKFCNSME